MNIAKTRIIENQLLSQYVENLYFHTDRAIPNQTIIKILNTFPNLHCIQGLNAQKQQQYLSSSRKVIISSQDRMEYLYYWYQDYYEQWMETLEKDHDKIKLLELCIRQNILVSNGKEEENQPSKKPIIHFTFIRDVVLFSNSRVYKIYALKIPMMSYLNHLLIDYSIYGGSDEQIFESIHQSCPQLKSLILKSFNMYTSDYYKKNHNHRLTVPSLQPNISLKELSIDYGINDPACYDYLSFKYPHLESLSLSLDFVRCPDSFVSSFRWAIYDMITRYSYLKELKVSFKDGYNKYDIWPLTLLLEWIQKNSTQLHCLDYPYNFTIESLKTDDHDYYDNEDYDDNDSINPLTVTFMHIPIQEHDYLNHLSSLSLGDRSSSAIDALFYFYLCNHEFGRTFISSSIETLALRFSSCGDIYFWLYGFPNLKSLSISGYYGTTLVTDSINGAYSNSYYPEEILRYLKKRMKRQKQQPWMYLSSSTEVETKAIYFKLQKLEIKDCNVHFKNHGWDGLFQKLPDLKTVILSKINRVGTIDNKMEKKLVSPPLDYVFFNWSHLSLDLLQMNNFNDQPYYVWKTPKKHYVKELMIDETSLDKEYYVGPDNLFSDIHSYNPNSTTLCIKCKYIEHIDFHNH
ncbi:unnamed protein product [Cunninghamella blakesleeana]